jgi:integrase
MLDLGVIDGKRKRKAVYGDTRKEAAIKLQETLTAKSSGSLVIGQVTVETWLKYWLDVICVERGLKVNTMKSHRSKVEQYLIPHLGHHRLDRLGPEHVRAMYAAMRQDRKSEATLRQTHAILHRALKVAVREGKASRNVADLIDPPKTERKKRTGLTLPQARKVLKIAGLRWHVALWLGLRQGEALALRWSDINLEEGWLVVERTLVRVPGQGLRFDTPKSRSSRRVVPLPTPALARFKVAWAEHLAAGGGPDDLVFHRDGMPLDHRADWQAWSDLLERAGVPHIALHAARNTTASLLEEAGVAPRLVMEILGQSSVEVTYGYQAGDLERHRDSMRALVALVGE